MDDVVFVGVLQPVERTQHQRTCLVDGEATAAAFHQLVDATPWAELHNEIRPVAFQVVVEHRHAVGMITESLLHRDFPFEHLPASATGGSLGQHHLERHLLAIALPGGEIHGSHPTSAEHLADLIAGNLPHARPAGSPRSAPSFQKQLDQNRQRIVALTGVDLADGVPRPGRRRPLPGTLCSLPAVRAASFGAAPRNTLDLPPALDADDRCLDRHGEDGRAGADLVTVL